jgi:hypothetical protein
MHRSLLPSRLLFSSLLVLSACSGFRQVTSVDDLKPTEKVVVGEIRVVRGEVSDWVPGMVTGIDLRADYQLPMKGDGHIFVALGDGLAVQSSDRGPPIGRMGGVFRIAFDRDRRAYLLSLQVSSMEFGASHVQAFPLLIRIQPSTNKCEYIGTFIIERKVDTLVLTVRDDYDRDAATYTRMVRGCALQKAVATHVDQAELNYIERRARESR